jgi:hypothetical protein
MLKEDKELNYHIRFLLQNFINIVVDYEQLNQQPLIGRILIWVWF